MKQNQKKGAKNQVGAYGEEIAVTYLQNKGFSILDTNYLKKWGEIDVIAKQEGRVHFVEVKTVSYETKADLTSAVARGTYAPEEQVHASKLKKLSRVIETWIIEHEWEGEWQIDVAAVRIVPRETYATVKYIPNIIMD